jgi:hypothetical protein
VRRPLIAADHSVAPSPLELLYRATLARDQVPLALLCVTVEVLDNRVVAAC